MLLDEIGAGFDQRFGLVAMGRMAAVGQGQRF
jgi:hypothetical protein